MEAALQPLGNDLKEKALNVMRKSKHRHEQEARKLDETQTSKEGLSGREDVYMLKISYTLMVIQLL